ncbi:MAG: cell envelope biogenesis protein OmpA [Bacteroidetes bacterium HGW-Bacteroidetes-2]|jgi:outer membrane protein OmpA-like peptidoglycan-associated protein/tetratricopeptide (TPR) repeat protein|nr:MAG: cell envelope biogenesis protein OmpA [Bacteroidetes bacterium HGW-Bacteroidetes-2]
MKKLYTIVFLLVASTSLMFAQNKDTKTADTHFDRFEYVKAAEAYQNLIKRGKADEYVYTRLADSYYLINDTKKAETFYKRVSTRPKVASETIYNYAQTLKANGKFEESNAMMQKFAQMSPKDTRAIDFKNNPSYIPQILEGKPKFSATLMSDLNSKFSDFGVRKAGNTIYFSSARNTTRKNYGRNQEPFLDIYEASYTNGKVTNIQTLKGEVNTKYHEGTVAISPDGKRLYFDRNDFYNGKYKKDEEGINQLNIYFAELVDGQWKDIKPVPFNNTEYSVGHPALSPNGNTLYFVSDMPGSIGDSDIYKVSISPTGEFGTPVNLGKGINTEGKEVFPFIGDNGTLYFSSDGHLGLGGLDVFYAEKAGDGYGEVKNIGLPINSSSDDFSFSIDDSTQEGFVSSSRGGSKEVSSDNVYRIKELCVSTIHSIVKDANNNNPLGGATVTLYDANQNKLTSKTAGADGKATFEVECDKNITVQAAIDGYESNATKVSTADKNVTAQLMLRPIEELIVEDKVVLNPILFDYDKHNIKPIAALELDKLVQLMKKSPTMVIKVQSHTDTQGTDTYNKQLSNRRAQATVQYVISKGIDGNRISGEGFGESNPAVNCGDNCTEVQHQQNRRSEFIIINR